MQINVDIPVALAYPVRMVSRKTISENKEHFSPRQSGRTASTTRCLSTRTGAVHFDNMKRIPLNDYKTGNRLGDVEVTKDEYYNIEAHAQKPQGIFRADELAPEQWAKLGLRADQTVYFDGTWA